MTSRTSGDWVAMVMRRMVVLLAVALLTLTSWLALAAGEAVADPYDDGDSTVEVAPDVAAEEVPQDPTEANGSGGAEEPAPVEEPVPAEPGNGAPDADLGVAAPPDGSTVDEPSSPGGRNDSAGTPTPEPPAGGARDDEAQEITPDNPEADPDQTKQALDSTPVVAEVRRADDTTITEMRSSVQSELSTSTSLQVTQWSSSWTRYDQYYQPLIANPFPVPIRLVYTYADLPYVLTIPPLAQSVLNVPTPGVYSFTAVVPDKSGGVASVSVGSFSGGGYVPKPGQPPPRKPPAPARYANVLVRFDLAGVQYQPVVVKTVIDLGDDPKTGTRKVLLDEETPAWGSWADTGSGQREFTVGSTQSLPGLTPPATSAPPGYQLTASPTSSTSGGTSMVTWVALGLGIVAVVAVLVVVLVRRRQHPDEA